MAKLQVYSYSPKNVVHVVFVFLSIAIDLVHETVRATTIFYVNSFATL